MHYLLFFPDARPADIETRAKLADIASFIDGSQDVLHVESAVRGQCGTMVGWLSPGNPHLHYDSIRQEWQPSIAKDEHGNPLYHIGFWRDSPPQERELRRRYGQKGITRKLGQQEWIIPTPETVDARAVYADDGTMKWEVTRQFSWLCAEAQHLQETYLQELGLRAMLFNVNPKAQVDWLLRLLQINYRLTPEAAAYLELWTGRDHLLDVFLATLNLERKKPADG